MSVSRREFLKMAGGAMGGLMLAPVVTPAKRSAARRHVAAENSASILYDATLCVGCRACQQACRNRPDRPLPPTLDSSGTYDAPTDLTANTWTIIKLYQSADGTEASFVKNQCMHCIEPACVSVCPVAALEKLESGPVIYHEDRCFGCRYCMAACPYHVPTYQWDRPLPYIQKCDFCSQLQQDGQEPVCSAVCPTGALKYGKRGDLVTEAEDRIANRPDTYVKHVYGKDEVGGAAKLYLAAVDFEKLGFPTLGTEALPAITWPYMMAVPAIIVGVGALMSAAYAYTHRKPKAQEA